MAMINWFKKASKVKLPDDDATNPAAVQQGNYTDHNWSPYQIRQHIAPLYGEELEAFDWVLDKMSKEHPECEHKQNELIEWGLDTGWLVVGDKGDLRVSKEMPT